ncbi:MAG: Guanylate kinase [Candidatus Omnitrophica bacterium]|nr:Guanylate kinase [Candidatus Omnitrophota bacterium]
MSNRTGKLFVISASSGTGKTTLAQALLQNDKNLIQSISYTTRQPRPNEINGKDYFFVTKQQFFGMREKGEFLEWANVFGRYYGTSRTFVEMHQKLGKDVLLLIDVQGAKKVKKLMPGAIYIFLSPPSKEELRRRLEKRGTESKAEIARRLKVAQQELRELNAMYDGRYLCDYRIVNRDIRKATEIVKTIISAEHLS